MPSIKAYTLYDFIYTSSTADYGNRNQITGCLLEDYKGLEQREPS